MVDGRWAEGRKKEKRKKEKGGVRMKMMMTGREVGALRR